MIRQFELVERVQSYDPDADEDMLNRAYVYGLRKHGTHRLCRLSLETKTLQKGR